MIAYLSCPSGITIIQPVNIIKAIRELTGKGLRESKDICDGFRDGSAPHQQIVILQDIYNYTKNEHYKALFKRNGISFIIGNLDRQTYDSLIDAVGKTLMVMTLSENKPIADAILNHIKTFEPQSDK